MISSFALRQQIEATLSNRIPSALTPVKRVIRAVTSTGVEALDAVLRGGLPCAGITEVVGPECSGRMTFALGCVEVITQRGNVCAWVDVGDGLDPESAAANGVDLERLLWVRCGGVVSAANVMSQAGVEAPVAKVPPMSTQQAGCSGLHPRSEGRNMPQAISAMLQVQPSQAQLSQTQLSQAQPSQTQLSQAQMRREERAIGTPRAPNRLLSQRSVDREEQVATDRLPARRGEKMVATHAYAAGDVGSRVKQRQSEKRAVPASEVRPAGKGWHALDQALRATDMLLQGGGFSVIVLDLGSVTAEMAWRIPLATWFRFRTACEQAGVSLLLLTQHACARSSAELVVRMHAGSLVADGKVLTGVRYEAQVERQRFEQHESRLVPARRPPQSERAGQWRSEAAWAQAR